MLVTCIFLNSFQDEDNEFEHFQDPEEFEGFQDSVPRNTEQPKITISKVDKYLVICLIYVILYIGHLM